MRKTTPYMLLVLWVFCASCSSKKEGSHVDDRGGDGTGIIECQSDEDCRDEEAWAFPEQVRCDDNGRCRECAVNEDCGPHGECRDSRQCILPPRCETDADCEEGLFYRRCVDGFCPFCESDDDCRTGDHCWKSQGDLGQCVRSEDVHPSCLDGSCPSPCEETQPEGDRITCVLSSPEPNDYDQSCTTDGDCALVHARTWNEDCECRCSDFAVSASDEDDLRADLPDGKSFFSCDDVPDCACDAVGARCDDRCEPAY